MVRFLKIILIIISSLVYFVLGVTFYTISNSTIDFSCISNYNPGNPSIVLDIHGNELFRYALDKRDFIAIKNIPAHVIHAFISAEDHSFFDHKGISFKGIIRSTLVNCYNGKFVQGASTITQQLVKQMFFDSKKSLMRKIKEQFFSILLETKFTKSQILEIYLNHIYLGGGIYGIEAAAQRFWSKKTEDLTQDEAAALAAIVQLPSKYCPLYSTDACKNRRNIILKSMSQLGYISNQEYEDLKQKDLIINSNFTGSHLDHLKDLIRSEVERHLDKKNLYSLGLTIQTTIDPQKQQKAYSLFEKHVLRLRKKLSQNLNGGLVCLECKTGNIVALVGGIEYEKSQFNRALQAKRQIGSIFKPIIYAQALYDGAKFSDIEIDEPTIFQFNGIDYAPGNYNRKFEGPMTLAQSLIKSNNIICVKTLLKTGIERVINLAKRFGIETIENKFPSLALGCIDLNLLQATAMFNVFANNGKYIKPKLLIWVKDKWGNKIYKSTQTQITALDSKINSQMVKVLANGMTRIRKMIPQNFIKSEAIGKTGTTNESRNCWFTGSTPDYTTGIFIGNDDNSPLGKDIFGTRTALPIWIDFNKSIEPEQAKFFTYDQNLKKIYINPENQKTSTSFDESHIEILI